MGMLKCYLAYLSSLKILDKVVHTFVSRNAALLWSCFTLNIYNSSGIAALILHFMNISRLYRVQSQRTAKYISANPTQNSHEPTAVRPMGLHESIYPRWVQFCHFNFSHFSPLNLASPSTSLLSSSEVLILSHIFSFFNPDRV